MLYADKAALANRARLRMLQIRERELGLYTRNSRVIATQSALLCGVAYSGLLYTKQAYYMNASSFTKHIYPIVLTVLLGFSLLALLNFNLLSMLGPGLALRGPDGSVAVSIEAIAIEYRTASFFFCLAVLCLHIVLITYAWGAGEPLATKVMLTLLSLYSLHAILNQALAVGRLFRVETYTSGAFTSHADVGAARSAPQSALLPRDVVRSDDAARAEPAHAETAHAGSACGMAGGSMPDTPRASAPWCAVSAAVSRGVELGLGTVGKGVEAVSVGTRGSSRSGSAAPRAAASRVAAPPSAPPCASTRSDPGLALGFQRADLHHALVLSATDDQRAEDALRAASSGGSNVEQAVGSDSMAATAPVLEIPARPVLSSAVAPAALAVVRPQAPDAPAPVPPVVGCARPSTPPRDLASLGLSAAIVDAYRAHGITQLYEWQATVYHRWSSRSPTRNLLLLAPTSGGKTLPAELLMLRRLEDAAREGAAAAGGGGAPSGTAAPARGLQPPQPDSPPWRPLALVVVPYVTLAREYERRLAALAAAAQQGGRARGAEARRGFGCVEAFYEHRGSLPLGSHVGIAVCTIERAVGVLRSLEREGRLDSLACAVLDELHLATDSSRGAKLELLVTKLVYIHSLSSGRLQLLAMSATLPSSERFAAWLRADLFGRELSRPQPLPVSLAFPSQGGAAVVRIEHVLPASAPSSGAQPLAARGAPPRGGRGQADAAAQAARLRTIVALCSQLRSVHRLSRMALLVFCPTKARAVSVATELLAAQPPRSAEERQRVRLRVQAWLQAATLDDEPSARPPLPNLPALEQLLACGIAYHTAGLSQLERSLVEELFRQGTLHTICATSTLAAGVNLPVDCVLVDGLHSVAGRLDAAAYRQMIGRAGRGPAADEPGAAHAQLPAVGAYLVVASEADGAEARALHESEVEGARSALSGQLELLLLHGLSSRLVGSVAEAEAFYACSLCAQLAPGERARETRVALDRMAASGLVVVAEGGVLHALPRGEACVALHAPLDVGLHLEQELVASLRHGLSLASLVHPLFVFAAPGEATPDERGWAQLCGLLRGCESADPELHRAMEALGVRADALNGAPPIGAQLWAHAQRRLLEALALNGLLASRGGARPPAGGAAAAQPSAAAASAHALAALSAEQAAALPHAALRQCSRVCAFIECLGWPAEFALAAKLREMLGALASDGCLAAELSAIPNLSRTDARLLHAAGLSTVELVAADTRAAAPKPGAPARARRGGAVLAAISKQRRWRLGGADPSQPPRRSTERSAAALQRAAVQIVEGARRLLAQRLGAHQRQVKEGRRALASIGAPVAQAAGARTREAHAPPQQQPQQQPQPQQKRSELARGGQPHRSLAPHMRNDAVSICQSGGSPPSLPDGADGGSPDAPCQPPLLRVDVTTTSDGQAAADADAAHWPLGGGGVHAARAGVPTASTAELLAALAAAHPLAALCVHAERPQARRSAQRAGAGGGGAAAEPVVAIAIAIVPAAGAQAAQPLGAAGRPTVFYLPLGAHSDEGWQAVRALLGGAGALAASASGCAGGCDVRGLCAFEATEQLRLLLAAAQRVQQARRARAAVASGEGEGEGEAAGADADDAAAEAGGCAFEEPDEPPAVRLPVHDPLVLAVLARGGLPACAQPQPQLGALMAEFGVPAADGGGGRRLSSADAACLQAALTLRLTRHLCALLASRPPPPPPAVRAWSEGSAEWLEARLPAVLSRMDLQGIRVDTTAIGRLYAELQRAREALEEEAGRQLGRRLNLGCKAEVTAALAELGHSERKANLAVLEELAAAGCLLAALALEHRRLVELSRNYAKLRRHVLRAADGSSVAYTQLRQAGCASGRLYYSDGGLNPQVLPKAAYLVRTPARAACASSLHESLSLGLQPHAPHAHDRPPEVLVRAQAFARPEARGTPPGGDSPARPPCTERSAEMADDGGERARQPLPAGALVGRLIGLAAGCTVANCVVRASVDGRSVELTLDRLWGYSAEVAVRMQVALVRLDQPMPDQPMLAADAANAADAAAAAAAAAAATAEAGGDGGDGGTPAGGAQGAGSQGGGARRWVVPFPADRVHAVLAYPAVNWADWAPAAHPPPPAESLALLERTHPPAGALLVRPSRRIRVKLRACVRARPGCVLVAADYRTAELAIVAHLSRDASLIDALSAERDPFETIALRMRAASACARAGGGAEQDGRVRANERAAAKQACYALLYGSGSAEGVGRFFESFPNVPRLIARLQESCAQPGAAVHTLSGRRRAFSEAERKDSGLIRRHALNAVCQGSVADLVKMAMIANDDLDERLSAVRGAPTRVRLLMHLHDELVYEVGPAVPPGNAAAEAAPGGDALRLAVDGIVEGMVGAGRRSHLRLPLRVSVKVGLTWGGAQPYTPSG